jgi:DNA-binding winged helix-turn-helix (wHTH) protein/TolB-like protein/Tfp pilus assembly protein PilF
MSNGHNNILDFGNCRLDMSSKLLWSDGEPVALPPKAVELLCVLVEKPGEVVTKEEIWRNVWDDAFVEETNLTHNIYLLRKAFKDLGADGLIQTVPRRGYRFTGKIRGAQDGDLVIVRHALTETIIEEISDDTEALRLISPQAVRRYSRIAAVSTVVLVLLAAAWYYRASLSPARALDPEATKTVAVIPLKILSESTDDNAFGLGFTDGLVSRLGNLPFLVVRPASSVKKVADLQADPIEVGRTVKADIVLEGNYQRSEGRIRINVRVLNVADGSQIWSGKFEETETELFKLQDSLSNQVVQSLTSKLSKSDSHMPQTPLTNNKDAYQSYIRGRYFWSKRSGESLYKAIDYLKEATELDPNFSEAYAFLADSQYMLFDYNFEVNPTIVELARDNLRKSLALNPDLPEALTTQGAIQMTYDWNWVNAESSFKRAIQVSPNFATARQRYGAMLIRMGRFSDAEVEFNKAIELDPVSITAITNLGMVYFCKKDFLAAENQFRHALEIDDRFSTAHWLLSRCLWQQGKHDEAVAEIIRGLELDDNSLLARRIEQKDLEGGSDMAIRQLLYDWRENPPGTNPHNLAYLSTYINDKEKAVYWLQRSLQERHPWTLWLRAAPEFESLQGDPRVKEILRQINL